MKRRMISRYSSLIFSMLISIFLIACATNPVTGKRELMLMSESEEIALGAQYDPSVVAEYGLYDDPKITAFVNRVGQDMAKISHRPELEYHFRVLDSPVINAFAVPGGYIYITRGILAYLNNEAAFAGVMGHEIGHITARHSAKQQTKAQLAGLGLGIGSVISPTAAQLAGVASQGLGLLFLKFGRDDERQSDDLGVEYSTKTGYDARYMAEFFHTLDRMRSQEQGALPDWFSTHPNPADRVADVTAKAEAIQNELNTRNLKVDRDEYLNLIDGLIFGDDPQNGYMERNMFYHPGLTLQFPVPVDWQYMNTPSEVQLGSPNQDAAIIFTIARESSPAEAATAFLTNNNATSVENGAKKVNGLTAQRVVSDIATEQGNLRLLSYFIAFEGKIYAFHGFTAAEKFADYRTTFESVMTGFAKLTDNSKINVKPDRIRVKKVSRSGSLQLVLNQLGVAEDMLETTALLNAMELTDQVPFNTLIKIVAK